MLRQRSSRNFRRYNNKSSGNIGKVHSHVSCEFGHLNRVIKKYSNLTNLNIKELYKELATNELDPNPPNQSLQIKKVGKRIHCDSEQVQKFPGKNWQPKYHVSNESYQTKQVEPPTPTIERLLSFDQIKPAILKPVAKVSQKNILKMKGHKSSQSISHSFSRPATQKNKVIQRTNIGQKSIRQLQIENKENNPKYTLSNKQLEVLLTKSKEYASSQAQKASKRQSMQLSPTQSRGNYHLPRQKTFQQGLHVNNHPKPILSPNTHLKEIMPSLIVSPISSVSTIHHCLPFQNEEIQKQIQISLRPKSQTRSFSNIPSPQSQSYCKNGHQLVLLYERPKYYAVDSVLICNGCAKAIFMSHGFSHCGLCQQDYCVECNKSVQLQFKKQQNYNTFSNNNNSNNILQNYQAFVPKSFIRPKSQSKAPKQFCFNLVTQSSARQKVGI